MLCVLNVNKAVELEFILQVTGSTAKSIEPRFVIIGPEFAVICLCTPEKDKIKVKIPKLESILPVGKYDVRFEVIVGEQLFVPLKDQVELKGKSKRDKSEEVPPTIIASFNAPQTTEESVVQPEPVADIESSETHLIIEAIPQLETLPVDEKPTITEQVAMPMLQQAQLSIKPEETDFSSYVTEAVARSAKVQQTGTFSLIKTLSK